MSEERPKEPCVVCGEEIPADARQCRYCRSPRHKDVTCVVCGMYVAQGAGRCNNCSSFQTWWKRHLTFSATILSLFVALISVLTFALPRITEYRNRESRTVATFLSATEEAIYIRVRNTGYSPSTLRGYRLKFEELDIDPAPLTLVRTGAPETRDYVPERGQVTIGLTTRGLRSGIPRADLEKRISGIAMLEVSVQESDDDYGSSQRRVVPIPAEQIAEFILTKVPEVQ